MKCSLRFRSVLFAVPSLVALAILGMGWSGAAQANIIAYWPMNAGTGTAASDLSGNGNNGTLTAISGGGVPTWSTGHTGLAGDYAVNVAVGGDIVVPDATSLHITNTWTVAGWLNDAGSNYGHLFSAGADSTHRTWLLQDSSYGGDSDYFWSDTGNTGFKKSLSYVTPLNGWHHLAVTYDGANLRTYGDGVLKSTKAQTGSLAAWGTLHLGAAANNSGSLGSQINGSIDDLIILNNTASASDVTAIMNGTYAGMAVPEPSTFALLGIGAMGLIGYALRKRKQAA